MLGFSILRPAAVLASSLVIVCLCPLRSPADTHDFGGWEERFKGEGDMEPPACQIDVPRTAGAPFFVKWNCTDNEAPADEIRSELWILRKNNRAPEKLADFLGFPASVQIDAGILDVDDFTDGLPVQFRLVARDRAGVGVVTPYVRVTADSNGINTCDLALAASATESSGGTTGTPAATVVVDNAAVTVQTGSTSTRVNTVRQVQADPCDIDEVCGDDEEIAFTVSFSASGSSSGDADSSSSSSMSVTGTLQVSPGLSGAELSGTAEMRNSEVSSLQMTGTASIDGAQTAVTLTCSRGSN